MKAKITRFLAILLSMALIAGIAVACGGSSDTDTPAQAPPSEGSADSGSSTTDSGSGSSDDSSSSGGKAVLSPGNPVTLTTWIATDNSLPAPDNKITQLMKDELGVTIEYELTTRDNEAMRIGTMLAGGDYPDLMATVDIDHTLIKGGAYIKLDDWLATGDYPLLKAHVEPYMGYLSFRGDEVEDGFYIFPNYNRFYNGIPGSDHWGFGFWIQKAVLEDAGYPELENMTLERYFGLIENYMEKYPTIDGMPTIGFMSNIAEGFQWRLINAPGVLAGSPNNGEVIVDENNIARFYATSDYAERYFRYLNEMTAKGILDVESFSLTNDQYNAKIANGNVLGFFDQRWTMFGVDSLASAGRYERTYVGLMPTFDGIEPWYADRDAMNRLQGFGVSTSCRQVEVALAFLEEMMTEKWQKILFWGIEGEDYLINDDGMFYRTEAMREEQSDIVWNSTNRLMALRDQLPKRQGYYDDGNSFDPGGSPIEFAESLSDYDRNFLENYGRRTWKEFFNDPPDNPVYYPCWNIQLSDEAVMIRTQMEDVEKDYLPRIVMAGPANFDALWEEYIAELGKIDLDIFLADIQAGINERIEMAG